MQWVSQRSSCYYSVYQKKRDSPQTSLITLFRYTGMHRQVISAPRIKSFSIWSPKSWLVKKKKKKKKGCNVVQLYTHINLKCTCLTFSWKALESPESFFGCTRLSGQRGARWISLRASHFTVSGRPAAAPPALPVRLAHSSG